ncbi:MAG: tyrosine-type recombinase/integrase [Bacillota bacterium]
MEFVEPIRDIESINKIKSLLQQKSHRDYVLFVLGINTGLRISDLLNLTVDDVWDGKRIREFLTIAGTPEDKAVFLNNNARDALGAYLRDEELSNDSFLFGTKKRNKPITRQQAYRIINQAAKDVGVQGKVGTHTIRKTFGYHAYRKGIAISIIQEIFGHASPSETLKYLGIDKGASKGLVRVDVNL